MKRSLKIIACFSMISLVLVGLFLLRVGQARATAVSSCTWTASPSANPTGATVNRLLGVTALSATNVWAIGYTGNWEYPLAFIEQWDGQSWKLVPTPTPGPGNNELTGITALSAKNIWTVGFTTNGSMQTLTEHWNGTAWSVIPSPNVGASDNLSSVTSVSGKDVWAVGGLYNSSTSTQQTLIEHWNGTRWMVVSSPSPGTYASTLYAVKALSATNVWAVGSYQNYGGFIQTLIEHWDGTTWRVFSPPSTISSGYLTSLAAVSATNIWAVGQTNTQPLIEHWNGSAWSSVAGPIAGQNSTLRGVAAVGGSDVWIVGYSGNPLPQQPAQTFVEQWNGTHWNVVASPNPSTTSALFGVTSVPGTKQAWAVGTYYDNSGNEWTLSEFHC